MYLVMEFLKEILLIGAIVLFIAGATILIFRSAKSANSKENTSGEIEIGNADQITGATTEETTTEEITWYPQQETTESIWNNSLSAEVSDTTGTSSDATSVTSSDLDESSFEDTIDDAESSYTLNDVDAPIFLIKPSSCNISVGSEFNPGDFIGYADDVDRDVEVTVTGDLDTSTIGSYPVTVTLTDDFGHSTSDSMTVNVVASTGSSSESSGELGAGSYSWSSFSDTYGGDDVMLGIDVSRWQGTIDFEKVKAAGCEFAMIRIGGFDDGSQYTDRMYSQYIKDAKAAGLKVGIYWHAEESTTAEVKDNVDYLMNILGGESLDLPIAYDWEDFYHFQNYGMNLYDINTNFNTFADEVTRNGYHVCLYSSLNFLNNVWTNKNGHPVWLAHYTSSTNYTGSYFMWQQCNTGLIDGISKATDFNVLYKNTEY